MAERDQAFAEGCTLRNGSDPRNSEIVVDLAEFNLSNARLSGITFCGGSSLAGADLSGAVLNDVTFSAGVELQNADFSHAELNNVTFEKGSDIDGASFRFSKFGTGVRIEFDRNQILNATFRESRKDSWARLSASFAGIWQYINLTLSGAYFGLLLCKLYLFNAISSVHAVLVTPFVAQTPTTSFSKVSVWRFVFGEDWTTVLVAIGVFTYQVLRLFATTRIGPLIEAERRSGYTPALSQYAEYVILHQVTRALGYGVLLIFLYEVWQLITQESLLFPTVPPLSQ